MATLASAILTDRSNVFLRTNDFAETVTYTPDGGAGSSITAIIEEEQVRQEQRGGYVYTVRAITVTLSLADVATPAIKDLITYDSIDYEVMPEGMRLDDGMASLACENWQVLERAAEGYEAL